MEVHPRNERPSVLPLHIGETVGKVILIECGRKAVAFPHTCFIVEQVKVRYAYPVPEPLLPRWCVKNIGAVWRHGERLRLRDAPVLRRFPVVQLKITVLTLFEKKRVKSVVVLQIEHSRPIVIKCEILERNLVARTGDERPAAGTSYCEHHQHQKVSSHLR